MKINKITMALIAAAAVLTVCPAVHAQTETNAATATPAPRARGGGGRLTLDAIDKAVTLTEAEKPKAKAAFDEFTTAMTAAREGGQMDRTKMTAAREDLDKKMKDILTPEQYTKYQAMPRGGRRGGAGGAGGGGNAPAGN